MSLAITPLGLRRFDMQNSSLGLVWRSLRDIIVFVRSKIRTHFLDMKPDLQKAHRLPVLGLLSPVIHQRLLPASQRLMALGTTLKQLETAQLVAMTRFIVTTKQ